MCRTVQCLSLLFLLIICQVLLTLIAPYYISYILRVPSHTMGKLLQKLRNFVHPLWILEAINQ